MIPLTLRPAQPAEWPMALELALCHRLPEERRVQSINLQTMLAGGELDPQGLVLALDQDEFLRGVVLTAALVGGSGLIWPPQVNWDEPGPVHPWIEDRLVAAGLAWLREQGSRLVQMFLPAQETPLAEPLQRAGFRHITGLRYLRHELMDLHPLEEKAALEFLTYDQVTPEVFLSTLMQSYEGTLDCPELTGQRSPAEIMAGHGAEPGADPRLWWLVQEQGDILGVVLLARMPEGEGWDLSYFGLVPAARGRGVGQQIIRTMLHRAHEAGALQVMLAVDERNLPALNLYRMEGFEEGERREVFLWLEEGKNLATDGHG